MATTRRRYDQNTLHAKDAIAKIRREDIGKVIVDINEDIVLTGVEIDPKTDDAERYEFYVEINKGERIKAATALRADSIYMVSFGLIPERKYENDAKQRETAEIIMEALKEKFQRHKYVEPR